MRVELGQQRERKGKVKARAKKKRYCLLLLDASEEEGVIGSYREDRVGSQAWSPNCRNAPMYLPATSQPTAEA